MATQTQTKPTTVTFYATGPVLLERVIPQEVLTAQGKTREIPGTKVHYQFDSAEGGLHKLELGHDQDMLPVIPELPDGEKESAVDWIRRHDLFGDRVFEMEAEAPDPGETLAEIATYGAEGNADAIAKILSVETSDEGWNREIVVNTATATLHAIEGRSAPPPTE